MPIPSENDATDRRLASVLPAGRLYAVGGRVRDELRSAELGEELPIKDLDYVVLGMSLGELEKSLSAIGRTDVVGASFSVVKCSLPGGPTVDVALPRRERSVGTGHRDFVVESGPDVTLDEDLSRRDFRMNMIARAIPGGEIVDPYGGADDIRARRVDLLKATAFEEDPLRMLRAAQFAARFEFAVTSGTFAAMRAAAPLVATVSAERVRDELAKLIGLAPKPSIGLELLRETGILAIVLPELVEGVGIEQNEWHAYDVYRHTLATVDATPAGDRTLRFAALFHDVGKPRTKDGPHFYRHEAVGAEMTAAILDRLRFPGDEAATVVSLVRHHMYVANPEARDGVIRRVINAVGVDRLDRQFALRAADVVGSGKPKRDDSNERFEERVRALVAERPAFSVRDLAIDGGDVIAALVAAGRLPPGSRGGKDVGALLSALFERVTDDPGLNDRPRLLALLDDLVRRST